MPFRIKSALRGALLGAGLAAGLFAAPAHAQQGVLPTPPAGGTAAPAPSVPNYENAASGGAMTRGPGVGDTAGAASGTIGGGPGVGLGTPSGGPSR